ncbi:hypothetical protein [Enterococcus faecium]|uniref:hypothetical protein n=1 Tax=Enterococcus faecium TaxID=1352 RepID=UPI001EDE232F|nr:hypothetical protein [Enterococcus faecium]MCG4570002.1 hypothetical protein [Enterococcus faecium]
MLHGLLSFTQLYGLYPTLTILFFLCYSYLKTSHAPSSALGWLLLDHSDITEAEENPFFLILSSLCGLLFSVYFGAYFFHRHPGTLNEASSVLIAFKTFSFLAILFYSFNHNTLFFFIVNGLVVILSIFTYFIFSLIFSQLKCPLFFRLVPVTCFIYSLFSFFVLALMPLTNPSTIQVAGNLLDMLFIVSLGVFMWQRKNKQNKKHFEA